MRVPLGLCLATGLSPVCLRRLAPDAHAQPLAAGVAS